MLTGSSFSVYRGSFFSSTFPTPSLVYVFGSLTYDKYRYLLVCEISLLAQHLEQWDLWLCLRLCGSLIT